MTMTQVRLLLEKGGSVEGNIDLDLDILTETPLQVVIMIIFTRPWPAYGRHGLAGSSGGDQFGRKKLLTFSLAPSALRSVGTDHREVTSFGGKNSSGYFLLFIGR